MSVNQTMRAMPPSKCEMTSGIQGHDKSPLQTGCVQAPHAEKTTQHVRSQLGVRRSPSVSQEMIQSVVYRPGLLLGLGQSVEIVQDLGAAGIEIEIELPATAELEQIQADPPPDEESLVIDDQRQKTGIGHAIQPPIKLGPEVEDCCGSASPRLTTGPFAVSAPGHGCGPGPD